MRELVVEKTTYQFKRRKSKDKEHEVKDYLGGLSVPVAPEDLYKWRLLLLIRYFGYFGRSEDADIKLYRKQSFLQPLSTGTRVTVAVLCLQNSP